jgi:uncharacterized protein (DUF2062 family)
MVYAMIIGGIVLGTTFGIPAYYVTKRIFQRIQNRARANAQSLPSQDTPPPQH